MSLGRRARTFAALLLLAVPTVVHAQVNIERLRLAGADTSLSGTAGAEFSARTGNVSLVLLDLNGRVDYGRRRWATFLVGSNEFGWQGGKRFSNQGLLHLRFGYHFTSVVTGETFAQTDYDKSRLLTFRFVTGAGPRFTLARSDGWRLAIGTAYMFEHEQYDLPLTAVHPRRIDDSRWSNYLALSYGEGDGGRVALALTGYAQPQITDFANVRILGDLTFAVRIVHAVSLTVSSNLRYDSRPPDGIESLDTATKTGVALSW